jgi:hypothetical protein
VLAPVQRAALAALLTLTVALVERRLRRALARRSADVTDVAG